MRQSGLDTKKYTNIWDQHSAIKTMLQSHQKWIEFGGGDVKKRMELLLSHGRDKWLTDAAAKRNPAAHAFGQIVVATLLGKNLLTKDAKHTGKKILFNPAAKTLTIDGKKYSTDDIGGIRNHGKQVKQHASPRAEMKAMTEALNVEPPEKLVGGKGDSVPDTAFNDKSLAKGAKVESEHTKDPAVAKEIAKDHLSEDPKYYDKLAKMESPKNFPGRVRNYRAGPYNGSIGFQDQLHRDAYDTAASWKNAVGSAGSLRSKSQEMKTWSADQYERRITNLANQLGISKADALSFALDVHNETKAQMKGVKDDEHRDTTYTPYKSRETPKAEKPKAEKPKKHLHDMTYDEIEGHLQADREHDRKRMTEIFGDEAKAQKVSRGIGSSNDTTVAKAEALIEALPPDKRAEYEKHIRTDSPSGYGEEDLREMQRIISDVSGRNSDDIAFGLRRYMTDLPKAGSDPVGWTNKQSNAVAALKHAGRAAVGQGIDLGEVAAKAMAGAAARFSDPQDREFMMRKLKPFIKVTTGSSASGIAGSPKLKALKAAKKPHRPRAKKKP